MNGGFSLVEDRNSAGSADFVDRRVLRVDHCELRDPRLTRGYGSRPVKLSEPAAMWSNCAILEHLQKPNSEVSPHQQTLVTRRGTGIMPGLGRVLLAQGVAEADRALSRLAEVHARRRALDVLVDGEGLVAAGSGPATISPEALAEPHGPLVRPAEVDAGIHSHAGQLDKHCEKIRREVFCWIPRSKSEFIIRVNESAR